MKDCSSIPTFTVNYPFEPETPWILPTPQRVQAHTGFTGRGSVMAFLDSGFSNHYDLRRRIRLHVDATTDQILEQPRILKTAVTSWHGQMTSVIAAGSGARSGGFYRGIAAASELVLVKVSDPEHRVREADILRGLKWVMQNYERLNIQILNISLGGDFTSQNPDHPIHRCVRRLSEAGVVVVVAAGNSGRHFLLPPASAPEAIVVGGYDDQNTFDREKWRSYTNNHGLAHDGTRKPDIVAPAKWIASPILPGTRVSRQARWLAPLLYNEEPDDALNDLLRNGYRSFNISYERAQKPDAAVYERLQQRIHDHKIIHRYYQHVDGTSVAAPIVSSVIAQMLEANPALLPEQIQSILQETAQPISNVPTYLQGAGALNASAAVEMAVILNKMPLSHG